jgi:predicted P-loop ATPase
MSAAYNFLEQLRPGGPWVLTAIVPDGATTTITAKGAAGVDAFVGAYNGKRNLYYTVNPTRGEIRTKPAKTDIAALEYLFCDLDPLPTESPEAAKDRYLAAIEKHKPAITAIINSGNGIQGLFRLDERIDISQYQPVKNKEGELVLADDAANLVDDVEARCKSLMERLGSAAGTQNIDRLLRLPDTINLPNKSKVEKGRVACPSALLKFNGGTCQLSDFPKPAVEAAKEITAQAKIKIDWAKVDEHAGWLKTADDLPEGFSAKGRMIVACDEGLAELSDNLISDGLLAKPYVKWSAVGMAFTSILKADGRITPEKMAAALLCPLKCNSHIAKLEKLETKQRAIDRMLNRSFEPPAKRIAHLLPWRECKANGMPVPSMHNARLAITALGIACSHDTFHNKILFGYEGNDVRHELQSIVGEVTDNGIIRLRQVMSDRFGFDFEDKATRDAVKSLALDHCFDPVRDMLDKAQHEWDGVERLDEMAVKYFNCKDTKLNRAIVRKTMIAAVRRVRKPGCKFDTITVLESPEGWNKSSAWLVLAGDDNFSDESILGLRGREVQEQLSEVWIHENADLAGMRKAEVETIKAFASRQVDIARPAFGHFVVKQKRHSIEIGTTNSEEYLQSQTGNRRFWPLIVSKMIDLGLLRRDRMQLWGEAAKCEAASESIILDEALWPAAGVEQEKRRTVDPWEDILAVVPDRVFIGDPPELGASDTRKPKQIIHEVDQRQQVASADLLTHVLRIPIAQQETRHSMRLAVVMKRLGWERAGDRKKITVGDKQVRGFFRPEESPPF